MPSEATPPEPADQALESYDYPLPPELVAQEPLAVRDASRLLRFDRDSGRLEHRVFAELAEILRPGDLLVRNRSRVFPARLLGRRCGGGLAEILLTRARGGELWEALVRPARRLPPGSTVEIAAGFGARIEGLVASGAAGPRSPVRLVRLQAEAGPALEAVERHGHVPLPPYIRRADTPADRERYQTVFAREPGSVAAPTAGLHFTPQLLERLRDRGVETADLLLHVGPGTFRPVATADVRDHVVDAERIELPAECAAAIERARSEGRRVIAVGTTTSRALESSLDEQGRLRSGAAETRLVIVPGFRFRVVSALLTNFHLPRSSLLLLVSAFAGRGRVLEAYAEAVRQRYRFYSYGDAMLLE